MARNTKTRFPIPEIDEDVTAFAHTVKGMLKEGVGGLTSVRQLATKLASIKETKVEDERRAVRRHLKSTLPEEETIQFYAQAFGIDRDQLPAYQRKLRPQELLRAQALEVRERVVRSLKQAERLSKAARSKEGVDPQQLILVTETIRSQLAEIVEMTEKIHVRADDLKHQQEPQARPAVSVAR